MDRRSHFATIWIGHLTIPSNRTCKLFLQFEVAHRLCRGVLVSPYPSYRLNYLTSDYLKNEQNTLFQLIIDVKITFFQDLKRVIVCAFTTSFPADSGYKKKKVSDNL